MKRLFVLLLATAFAASASGCATVPEYMYDDDPPKESHSDSGKLSSEAGIQSQPKLDAAPASEENRPKEPESLVRKVGGTVLAVALMSALLMALIHNEPDGPPDDAGPLDSMGD